jgi:REP element-mobilizing transposase RayT
MLNWAGDGESSSEKNRVIIYLDNVGKRTISANLMAQYDPHKHHRRSIRLKGWDYRSPGYYFVTICSHERQNLFENSEYMDIAANALTEMPNQKYAQHVRLDEWVVMPNHVHAIIVFTSLAVQADMEETAEHFRHALAGSLGVVVGRYKTAVTSRINQLRQTTGARVWQRGYYESIIRNARELEAIQRYILDNPIRWAEDRENLDALLSRMRLRK